MISRKKATVRDKMFNQDLDKQQQACKNYEEEEVEEKLQKLMEVLDKFQSNQSLKYECFKSELTQICDFDHNFTFITVLRSKMNNTIFQMLTQIVYKSMNIFAMICYSGSMMKVLKPKNKTDQRHEEEAMNILLKTLKIIFLIQPKIIHGINNLNLLFSQIFWLFKQEQCSTRRQKLCIDLMEFFIEGSNFYFNLINIKDIREFIQYADYKQMAHFTKVLALLVLDVKKVKNPFKKQPSQYEESIIINNHQLLLSINNFVLKTIDICLFLTRITSNISVCQSRSELSEAIFNLDQSQVIQLSNFDIIPFQQICDRSDNETQRCFTSNYLLELCLKSCNLTEILFLLSNILQGKRKKEIQIELNKMGFVEQIFNPLFIIFFRHLNNNNSQGQGGSDLLQTSRIQLLRSIINFCDSDEQNKQIKDRMISFEEREYAKWNLFPQLIKNYNSEIDIQEQVQNIQWENILELNYSQNLFVNIKNRGTINLLISIYSDMEKSNNLSLKFWIASCVETFLRGSNQYHQIMILFYGLQHQITDKLFEKSESNQQNTNQNTKKKDPEEQILMDLMGEFTKYNLINIRYFYQYLRVKNKENKFIEILESNIIDSNVFLRSLWLTQNKLETQSISFPIEGYQTYERLNKFLVQWIILIIQTMCNQQLNQDNICCMNTLILIYLFAWNRGDQQELDIINKINELLNSCSDMKQKISDCFEQWENYYYFRGKDSFGLSYSTKIPFYYYQISKRRMCDLLDLHQNSQSSVAEDCYFQTQNSMLVDQQKRKSSNSATKSNSA
ncbi:hypothetical protein ABPG72_014325 [Tetrahymena utriculariae]